MANEIPVIPPDVRKVYLRLKRWRNSHARRVPIPESLWTAAGELARAHGINPTAKLCIWSMASSSSGRSCGTDGEEARGEGPGRRTAPSTAHGITEVCGADGTVSR